MSLWWLEPGWTETRCGCCGAVIWPEGDPDHGVCFSCFQHQYAEAERYAEMERQHNAEMDALTEGENHGR